MSDALAELIEECRKQGVTVEQLAIVMAACLKLGWVMLPRQEAEDGD